MFVDMTRLVSAMEEAELMLQSTETGSCKVSPLVILQSPLNRYHSFTLYIEDNTFVNTFIDIMHLAHNTLVKSSCLFSRVTSYRSERRKSR